MEEPLICDSTMDDGPWLGLVGGTVSWEIPGGYARPGGGPYASGNEDIAEEAFWKPSGTAEATTGDANLADMIAGSLKDGLAVNFDGVCSSKP